MRKGGSSIGHKRQAGGMLAGDVRGPVCKQPTLCSACAALRAENLHPPSQHPATHLLRRLGGRPLRQARPMVLGLAAHRPAAATLVLHTRRLSRLLCRIGFCCRLLCRFLCGALGSLQAQTEGDRRWWRSALAEMCKCQAEPCT